MSDSISFRPLNRSDFPQLQRWLAEPHVVAWWHEPLDLRAIETKYGPRIDGIEPTHVFAIEYYQRLVGWIQWYRWSDYQEHAQQLGADSKSAGVGLAIGEKELIGMGLGSSVIRQFLDQIVFVDPTISAIVTDPEEGNLRSLNAFKKVGFAIAKTVKLRDESFQRCVMHLSRLKQE
jgi:aminoglycoside 6'-N-acetyltransferase